MALPKAVIFISLLLAVRFSQQNPILVKAPGPIAEPEPEPEPELEPTDYRLDNEVVPENYKILLKLADDFVTSKRFIGTVDITLKVKGEQPSKKSVTLNAKFIRLLNKDDIILNLEGASVGNLLDTENIKEEPELERIVFPLKSTTQLNVDTKYVLRIPYEGQLHEDMYGFYLSSYKAKDSDTEIEWLATTQFQPTHARRAFPCFDEPEYKATFEITITHPASYQALSNAAILKRTDKADKSQTTVFEITPKMSTYVVAFVVCKFKSIYEYNEHVQENKAWAQPALVDLGKYAHEIGPKIIEKLNVYTGLEYSKFSSPIDKLDQIAIPDFSAGAMENWGLVTYRENALLYDENESERKQKQRVATVVGHELAHMWFGNLVTCKWWSSTWLNEGFARFFQYFSLKDIEKDWQMEKQFVIEQQRSILIGDASESSQPLTMDEDKILTPEQIRSRFGSITYNKGASVIRMMENFLGPMVFQDGIKKYLAAHPYGNTEPKDLWVTFDSAEALPPQTNLAAVMKSWTEKSGYPVVNVAMSEKSEKGVTLTQERFTWNKVKTEKNDAEEKGWFIPISYTTSKDPKFDNTIPQKWLEPEAKLELPDVIEDKETSWLILNIKDSAYYRVDYDEKLWANLRTNALTEENLEKIDELNRAQIVDDILNLARAGRQTYDLALTVASYLEHDIDYFPWYSAFNAFAYLRLRLNPDDKVVPLLNLYIRQLMKNLYESVSFESDVDKQIDIYKTALALTWACELGEETCIEKSKELFDNKQIQPDLKKVVYCTAIRNSESDENWKSLREQLKKTKLSSEMSIIISALGCSADEAILTEYLEDSVNPKSDIRSQDKPSVYTAVISGSPVGFKTAFSFLQSHTQKIKDNYGVNALSSVVTTTADRLTTDAQIGEFKTFIEENEALLGQAAEAGRDAIVQAEKNVEWATEHQDEIYDHLEKVVSTTTSSTTSSSTTEPTTTSTTTEPTTTKDPNSGTSLTICSTLLVLSILKAVFRL